MTNINGIASSHVQPGNTVDKTELTKTHHAKVTQSATGQVTQDAARLSGMGSLLASAAVRADDVRADKVGSLRVAINNGTYHVPAGDVADKMLKSMLE